MIALIWQFEVKHEGRAEFERIYGASGEWTDLARQSRSYLGSSFLRDLQHTNRYVLTEYWSEMLVYEQHQQNLRDDIERLNARRDQLIVAVEPIGVFSALDVPDRFGPTWSRRKATA